MKLFLVFVLAVSAVHAYAVPVQDGIFLKDSPIDKLIKQALEYIRKKMKEQEPLPIPQFPPQTIIDEGLDVTVDLNNLKISKASDFVVDKIDNEIKKLTADFQVSLPALHLEGDYKITGTLNGKDVKGSGPLVIDLDHFVQGGHTKASLANHEVQLEDIQLKYDFKGVKFDLQGLEIEGMSKEQVEEFLNKQVMDYIQNQKAELANKVASHIKELANKLMKGKSLTEVLEWLKEQIEN